MNCKSRTLTTNLVSIRTLKLNFEKHSLVTMHHLQIKQYFKSNNKIISHDAGEIALDIKTDEETRTIANNY